MKSLISSLILVFVLAACAVPPKLAPLAPARIDCAGFFIQGRWQFVHRLTYRGPGERSFTLLGVAVLSTDSKSLKTALITPEGMVLFEAESKEKLTIKRAVPPFDREGFARGLMEDVAMIFLGPGGPAVAGLYADGTPVCRYRLGKGGYIDTVWGKKSTRRILRYDPSGRLVRQVDLQRGAPAEGKMTLTAFGRADYVIEMEGVEAVRLGQ